MESNSVLLLDTGILGKICKKPKDRDRNINCILEFIKNKKLNIRVPEICDYELRRNFILEKLDKSISTLNKFRQQDRLLFFDTQTMIIAAEIWAEVRKQGKPTENKDNLDGDVILAAQACQAKEDFEEVIVLTTNAKDIGKFNYLGIKTWDFKQAIVDCKNKEFNFYSDVI